MDFEQDRKVQVSSLIAKTKSLQFEVSARKSKCSVESGIGECLIDSNMLKVEINQKDLSANISHLKSLEILNTYGSSIVSKHYYLVDGVIHIELEVSDNLEVHQDEVTLEVRLTYKVK